MRLWRYCLAGFAFDWLLYVVWTVIPLYGDDLGADALELALFPAASSVVYVTMSIVMGRVADRVARPLLVRVGCVLMAAGCLLIPQARSVWTLLALMPLVGVSGTFFWPSVQAAIGAQARPETLERDIGLFNILWSAGKAVGFLTGAAMKGTWGVAPAMAAAAAGALSIVAFYPWREDAKASSARAADPVAPERRAALLRMSWVANFVSFGVGAVVTGLSIELLKKRSLHLGVGADPVELYFGIFLFAAFVAQTLAFVVLSRTRRWTYRRWPLHLAQALVLAAALALAHVESPGALLLFAPALGVGLGLSYAASIYYSLHTPAGHGRYSGLHEAILGSGGFLLPLAAGAAAGAWGDLRWPYWLSAGAAIFAIVAQEAIYRRVIASRAA